ncbi:pyruvate dehydrogenase protein X component-like [Amphiura filiformis]|uniref:pyruvate dehydrogenase protein X component-like n=2 Tax=Amphiura filiformis TaxID=82378 RepID=UPI003B219C0A
MATIRALGCLRTRASLQRILQLNPTFLGQSHARCLHRAAILCGVDPIKLTMPALSPTMEEGTIAKWFKQEGDPIEAGDAICDIETDKSTVVMEADDDGILAKILVPEGTKGIKINALIALMVAEGEDYKDVDMPADEDAPSTPAADIPEGMSDTTQYSSMRHAVGKASEPLSPAVRQLIEQHGLDPASIPPSGPHGRILKGDVLHYLESPLAAEVEAAPEPPPQRQIPPEASEPVHIEPLVGQPSSPFVEPILTVIEQEHKDIEISSVRRIIAKRLTESMFFVPHAYCTVEVKMNQVNKLRKQFKERGIKLSVNDFIIKAAATSLKEHPEVNAAWVDGIKLFEDIDISVAVATDRGLITPILTHVNKRGLVNISKTVKELVERAREGRLKPQEFQGGSFSVSNLGMFGISHFTAIVNPPQSAIIAIGGSRLVPSVDGGKPDTVATVTMSTDTRVVDGIMAAEFLEAFRQNIENPLRSGLL